MQFSVPLTAPNAVPVASVTEVITYPVNFVQTVTPPPGATALQLFAGLLSGTGTISASVKGAQTGQGYTNGTVVVGVGGLIVPINTAVDQSYVITWSESVGGSGTWALTVAALLSSVGAGTSVNVTCNCGSMGGAMLAYGVYDGTNPGVSGNPITWGAVEEVGATILQGDAETFLFPSGSLVIATLFASLELSGGSSWGFADTAIGAMQALADNVHGPAGPQGWPLSASYPFDQTLNASTKFIANFVALGGIAFNSQPVLTLEAFTRP